MDVIKIGSHVPPPNAGDDGEAMEKAKGTPSPDASSDTVEPSEPELLMPYDAGWYVAVVRCNCEKRIAESIKSYFKQEKIWFEYWVPIQKVNYLDKRTMKRRVREQPFLATFIFCHISVYHLNEIRFRPDVYKMLSLPGHRETYRLPDKELADYRRLVENTESMAVVSSGPLKKGQKVRIIEGNMAGLEAYVQRVSGKKAIIGNEIKYISGATIEIDRSCLEVVVED